MCRIPTFFGQKLSKISILEAAFVNVQWKTRKRNWRKSVHFTLSGLWLVNFTLRDTISKYKRLHAVFHAIKTSDACFHSKSYPMFFFNHLFSRLFNSARTEKFLASAVSSVQKLIACSANAIHMMICELIDKMVAFLTKTFIWQFLGNLEFFRNFTLKISRKLVFFGKADFWVFWKSIRVLIL